MEDGCQDRSQSILETGIPVWAIKNVPKKFHESKKYKSVIVLIPLSASVALI